MAKKFKKILEKIDREANVDGAKDDVARLREHFRLGRRLAARRLELGLSQQKLAQITGVQQAEISRIEGGGGNPTFETLRTIATGLKGTFEFQPRVARESHRRPRA